MDRAGGFQFRLLEPLHGVYWAGVVPTYVSAAIGIAIANAIGFPAVKRYQSWKSDPNRDRVCRRNWRGEYVPDLAVIRTERALWSALGLLVAFGLVCDFVIMSG